MLLLSFFNTWWRQMKLKLKRALENFLEKELFIVLGITSPGECLLSVGVVAEARTAAAVVGGGGP